MHWDVVIGRAGVSWEYESGSMTSLLFTGIRSSLTLTFPIYTLPSSPHLSLSNHIDAVQQVTRLVMSKANLTTYFPYDDDLIHVTASFELKSSAQSSSGPLFIKCMADRVIQMLLLFLYIMKNLFYF